MATYNATTAEMANREYATKTVDDLISDRQHIVDALSACDDIETFGKTVLGKHNRKRLERDLAAVRQNYFHIKGTADEVSILLAKNQGREGMLRDEVAMFQDVEQNKRMLTSQLTFLDNAIRAQRQQKEEQR